MATRKIIMDIMGVRQFPVHTKYLGLPLSFGRKKSDLFRYLVEHTWQKVLGWKEKMLSFAGKEVLIKSILMAIPLYPMMCFKIPGSVCKRIFGIIRKFWWSHKGDERSISWIKSAILYKDESEGGLNFRDLELVNEALLGKQF